MRKPKHRRTAATPEQLRARLGLRASNAAQPHTDRSRARKRPGHGNRAAHQRRSITEQEH